MTKKEVGVQLEEMTAKYNQLYAEAVKLSDNRVIQQTQLMIAAVEHTDPSSELRNAYNNSIAVRLGVMKLDEPVPESQMKVSK